MRVLLWYNGIEVQVCLLLEPLVVTASACPGHLLNMSARCRRSIILFWSAFHTKFVVSSHRLIVCGCCL